MSRPALADPLAIIDLANLMAFRRAALFFPIKKATPV
jgi:hypothetical protein